jgi:hypothetical protein
MRRKQITGGLIAIIGLLGMIVTSSTRLRADTGTCGGANVTLPFVDVANTNIFFCSIRSRSPLIISTRCFV